MVNLVDRGLMWLLLQPIKEDLQLSDTQLGFVTGIAFAMFYATLGIPLARWADRGNRVTIASLAIGLWGFTVMACLFVTSYVQLVFARIAAAVGEAGCKPPTYSLVGDLFPEPAERTRAMAIYMIASPLASLLSMGAGGWLSDRYGWRMTFFLMGIPGLMLAVLVKLTLIEPRTRATVQNREEARPTLKAVLHILWFNRSLRHLSLALILVYAMCLGLAPWYAVFLMRSHGMAAAELGIWLGLIFSVGGIAGLSIGGYVGSRWFADNERGQMRWSAATVGFALPCFAAFLALPQKHDALIALATLIVVLSIFLGPVYALLQRMAPDRMRATLMSVVMLFTNLIGMGLGPQIVGMLSDWLAPRFGSDSLRYAMLTLSFLAPWAAYHFWQVGRTLKEDLSRAHSVASV